MSQDSYPNIKTKSVLFFPYASQDKDFKKSDSRIFLSQKKNSPGKNGPELNSENAISAFCSCPLIIFLVFKEIFFLHHFESRIKIVF